MKVVVDASTIVAALIDVGPAGLWAEQFLGTDNIAAPHLMPVEVTNILRRSAMKGLITADTASLALDDLGDLRVEFFEFQPFALRIWELRENVTAYDAWYVALAEAISAPVATLDHKLTRSSGPRCRFLSPGTDGS